MWDQLGNILRDKVQVAIERYIVSLKNKISIIYSHIVMSIVSIVILCYSLTSLLTRIADNLDLGRDFLWTYSMTLYLVLIIGSIISLKVNFRGAGSKPHFNAVPPERPINRISKRKKNGKRKKTRRS